MILTTKEGKEVKLGDIISRVKASGSSTIVTLIKVTNENYKDLIKEGILSEVTSTNSVYQNVPDETMVKMANNFFRSEIDEAPMDRIRKTIRFIAMLIDEKYPNNIKDVDNVYYIDIYNDLKINVTKSDWLAKYYKSIGYGLFRTQGEASFALSVIINILNGKK